MVPAEAKLARVVAVLEDDDFDVMDGYLFLIESLYCVHCVVLCCVVLCILVWIVCVFVCLSFCLSVFTFPVSFIALPLPRNEYNICKMTL